MKNRRLIGALAAVVVFLLIISMFLYWQKDRTGPVITFGDAAITYREGDSYDVLLSDATAIDDADGAVTVYVENVFPLYAENRAKIYYAAVDKSGNVTKESRIVTYVGADETSALEPPEPASSSPAPSPSPVPSSSPAPSPSPTPSSSPAPSPSPTPSSSPSPSPSPMPSSSPTPSTNAGMPVITLTTNRVTLNIGDSFSYMDYIAGMTDDVDSYEYLTRKISTNGGAINTAEEGTYEVEYKISNSRGVYSESVFLTVIVE